MSGAPQGGAAGGGMGLPIPGGAAGGIGGGTHGTSEQSRSWFTAGYESGDPAVRDTFAADDL